MSGLYSLFFLSRASDGCPVKEPKNIGIAMTVAATHAVKGNTDFDKIVSGDHFFFAAKPDRMVSSGEYRNTTEKWLQWYKSTVVVPIRVLEKNCDDNKKHYILLGFLCADSDSSGAFEEDGATLYADIMMAAADQLYYFLDFISSQRNRLKTDSSNQL
ncbi:MAG: hypothetical protein ACLQT6_12910 [Desulfomonilaceae bacterium]